MGDANWGCWPAFLGGVAAGAALAWAIVLVTQDGRSPPGPVRPGLPPAPVRQMTEEEVKRFKD
jgi:hypothetical protein